MLKNDQDIMKSRAEVISGRKKETESLFESLLVVEFLLDIEKYAIDSSFVTEVLSFKKLTPIPQTPQFIAGLLNNRGKIISVMNLVSFFAPNEIIVPKYNNIIVIQHNNMEFGIIADKITGTKQLNLSTLGALPVTINKMGTDYIYGVTPEGIILLNAISILSDNKLIINQK